jgi:hypothetical protein
MMSITIFQLQCALINNLTGSIKVEKPLGVRIVKATREKLPSECILKSDLQIHLGEMAVRGSEWQ